MTSLRNLSLGNLCIAAARSRSTGPKSPGGASRFTSSEQKTDDLNASKVGTKHGDNLFKSSDQENFENKGNCLVCEA